MSYLVLARKYRPRTFSEVAGQELAMRTLKGAIAEKRIGHAYLFHGPRGTGKTTTARIFAKALICERGPTQEPCGACDHCREVDLGSHPDVIEFDAASNTGVDDVRLLREQVGYAPMRARFKVYIVDEVHMMSRAAFNAFLKTLEEPPAHVKFLFATTDLAKVIETVRSRCQAVPLTLIDEPVIAARLSEIFARESVAAETGVADELARRGRGSLRDALSLADQLIAIAGTSPRLADVARVSPEGGAELVRELTDDLERGDRVAVLRGLARASGGETELANALLDRVRLALVCQLAPGEAQMFEPDPAAREDLAQLGARLGTERAQVWLEELLTARQRIQDLPQHARTVLEVTLLDLCRREAQLPLATIEQRLAALERRLANAPQATPRPSPASAPARAPSPRERAPAATPAPIPEEPAPTPRPADATWAALLADLKESSPRLAELLERRGRLVELSGERASVRVAMPSDAERALLGARSSVEACTAALARVTGRTMALDLGAAGARERPAPDEFTRQVADLFAGQIEEQ